MAVAKQAITVAQARASPPTMVLVSSNDNSFINFTSYNLYFFFVIKVLKKIQVKKHLDKNNI